MQLESSSIAILVISCLVSFGLGRLVLRWRKRRHQRLNPIVPVVKKSRRMDDTPALNKNKRRRQQRLQQGQSRP